MTERPLALFLAALEETIGVKPTNSGDAWTSRCPAHEDHKPSLSVAEGKDGRVLLKCHAGCSTDAVCRSLGLEPRHLFLPSVSTSTNSPEPREIERFVDVDGQRGPKTHATAEDTIAALERRLGQHSAKWWYHDADGNRVGGIVRWDRPDSEKEIRPIRHANTGWQIGGMPAPRPLYRLPELTSAKRVYVCEGEKACEAARSIDLVATTSPHGCQSPKQTDWSPLAGKEVVILPDNDSAGGDYADAVIDILTGLNPAPVIKRLDLPDLPDHGDIHDWLELRDAHDPGELRCTIEQSVDRLEPVLSNVARPRRFEPFPLDALPEPARTFVLAVSKAVVCDPSYTALPLLAVLASAIGNSRQLQLKAGWKVPPIIWAVIVGESGSAKTPASRPVHLLVQKRQREALRRHDEAMKQHELDLLCFEKDLTTWKRNKQTAEDPPCKPDSPTSERLVVNDTTVEALAPLLLQNPRGLLLARDELSGWIGSFDRYASGQGADAAQWLSMHSGESIIVDRKTGIPRTIYVPRASVCLTGSIQPGVLQRALGVEHRESGLAARLLMACPPRQPKRWTEAGIDPMLEGEMAILLDRLYQLEPEQDENGEPYPRIVHMTPAAKRRWIEFYNAHSAEQVELTGDLAAVWSKLEEYAARLALVVHLTRWASDDPTLDSEDRVDEVSMTSGITLARWFAHEARRIYRRLAESDEEQEQRELIELIDRRGGRITPRELAQKRRCYQPTNVAEKALSDLVSAGIGRWESVMTTTKPRREFVLSEPSTNSIETRKIERFVDVDTGGARQNDFRCVS